MKPQMNTVQPSRNPKNPPRRREEREVFEIAFLRVLRVFAVKKRLRCFVILRVFVSSRWISRCPSRGEFLDFRAAEAYDTPELRRD